MSSNPTGPEQPNYGPGNIFGPGSLFGPGGPFGPGGIFGPDDPDDPDYPDWPDPDEPDEPNNSDGPNDPIPGPDGPGPLEIPIITPVDPNEIIGPAGHDAIKWVSIKQTLPYKVLFENDPDFATAPAQNVTVYVPIHPKLNPSSLRLSDFGFGNFNFTVPPNTSVYSKRLDVRDSLGIFVNITAGLDVANRRAFWFFQSIDPATGLGATLPANKGFLPVNDTTRHNGEGFVSFTILPLSTDQTGDTVTAQASVIFDTEQILNTNKWFNTIDAVAPISNLRTLSTGVDSVFTVSWTGQDDPTGSGAKEYILYVSKNNGPFTIYKDKITKTSELVTGEPGARLAFYTRASDKAGNLEDEKNGGEKPASISIPSTSDISCTGASVIFSTTGISGATYQWQVNKGNGFSNLIDDNNYTGTSSPQLVIQQVLETYSGYAYRCQISSPPSISYSDVQVINFASRWLGTAGESWHNPANWSCGVVPSASTNVIIPADVPSNPVIIANAICRTLTMDKDSAITLKKDVELTLTGK